MAKQALTAVQSRVPINGATNPAKTLVRTQFTEQCLGGSSNTVTSSFPAPVEILSQVGIAVLTPVASHPLRDGLVSSCNLFLLIAGERHAYSDVVRYDLPQLLASTTLGLLLQPQTAAEQLMRRDPPHQAGL